MNSDDQRTKLDSSDMSDKSDTQIDEGVDLEDTSEAPLVGEATRNNTAVQRDISPQDMTGSTTVPGNLADDQIGADDTPVQSSVGGEEAISGSAPAVTSDDDVTEAVEEVIGNEPEPGVPFSMADEVEKDELARRGLVPDDIGMNESEDE